jgi:hypothetical protein
MNDAAEAMLREYATLRDEVLQSITHRTQIISFGLGAIATFIAGILVGVDRTDPQVLVAIFSAVVPAASLLLLYVWFTELARMFRASNHLIGVERRINEAIETDALTWEKHLADKGGKKRFRFHLLVVGLFVSVSASSPFLGIALSNEVTVRQVWLWGIGAAVSATVALHVGFWSNRLARGG